MSQKRQITQIEIQKRNKKRRSIYLDGEFAFGLDEELLFKFGLHEGDQVDEAELLEIVRAAEYKSAKDVALRYLSYRARSEKEVRDKLLGKGFDEEIVGNLLEELKQARLVDDNQFALAFVHDKMILRPMGPLLIRKELKNLGLSESAIELAVEEAFREKTPFEVAQEMVRRRFSQVKNLDWAKARKRLSDFLYRRGFDWEVTREVLELLEVEIQQENRF